MIKQLVERIKKFIKDHIVDDDPCNSCDCNCGDCKCEDCDCECKEVAPPKKKRGRPKKKKWD